MGLRLLMDVHVPKAIALALRADGIDVVLAQEAGLNTSADPLLLDFATDHDRVLFTRDKDFLRIAAECQRAGKPFCGIVYAAQLDVSIGTCIEDLRCMAGVYEAEDVRNQLFYLPL